MYDTSTFQNELIMISFGVDTMEKVMNLQLLLLVLILALILLIVGYLILNEINFRHKKSKEKKIYTSPNGHQVNELKSNIDKFLKIVANLKEDLINLPFYKDKADDFDKLEKKFDNLIIENKSLSEQKTKLESEIKHCQQQLQEKNNEVSEKQNEIKKIKKSNDEFVEKAKKAEILKGYAEKVVNYLDFCEGIIRNSNEKIFNTDIETTKILSALLQQALQKTIEIAKWKQICSDIKEKGIAIQNKDLISCFESNQETVQLIAFKKLCVSKLKIYTNALLILCEACSNLSQYSDNATVTILENEYKNIIREIKIKAKEIGILEIPEVKLFSSLGGCIAIDGTISFPYSVVKNLRKDHIIEIIEFGMKTEFEELTKTTVLIS